MLVAGLACASCQSDVGPTQVTVVFDAEGALRSAAALSIVVRGGEGAPTEERHVQTVVAPRFPLRLALVPLGGDARRRYAIEAELEDGSGARLARLVARSGYVDGDHRELRLVFTECCAAQNCDDTLTCRDCACADPEIDPRDLLPGSDAGVDAGMDAGPTDAGTTDAGADVDIVLDAGDGCLAPPRPLFPRNGARSRSTTVSFGWTDAPCGAEVEFAYATGGCPPGSPVANCVPSGPTANRILTPGVYRTSVPAGRVFWRVRTCLDTMCGAWSPTRYLESGRATCDFDGDGRSDIAIGAPLQDTPTDSGRVYVWDSSAIDGCDMDCPTSAAALLTAGTLQGGAQFGASLACADLDADGYDELIVSEPFRDGTTDDEGAIHVISGSNAGLRPEETTAPITPSSLSDPVVSAQFGTEVGSAGDLNGDGIEDLVVSAPAAFGGVGVVYLLAGQLAPVPLRRITRLDGVVRGFGQAVAGIGDLDADGFGDVGVNDRGQLMVVQGSPETPTTRTVPIPGTPATIAIAVGDVDGDGFDDVVLSVVASDTFHVWRPAGTMGTTMDSVTQGGALFGAIAVGDFLETGPDDVLVGAPIQERTFLFSGNVGDVPTFSSLAMGTVGTDAGSSVALLAVGGGGVQVLIGAPDVGGSNAVVERRHMGGLLQRYTPAGAEVMGLGSSIGRGLR